MEQNVNYLLVEQIAQDRRDELLQEAANERLVREALQAQDNHHDHSSIVDRIANFADTLVLNMAAQLAWVARRI